MLSLLPRSWTRSTRRPSANRDRIRSRLGLTRLEGRDCPAAPSIPTFEARLISGNWIITGQVSDENPGGCTVEIGGDVSGDADVYEDGAFEFIVPHTGTGSVTAIATDDEGLNSMTVMGFVSSPPGNAAPYISMQVMYNQQRSVTLFGQVYDDGSVSGLTVTFGGKVSGTAATASDGTFTFTQTATALGNVTASTVDGLGAGSNVPVIKLVSTVPTVDSLSLTVISSTVCRFSGHITDESPEGLTVNFVSGISVVDGQTATVNANGNYSLEVTVSSHISGTVVVRVTDWWGQTSEPYSICI